MSPAVFSTWKSIFLLSLIFCVSCNAAKEDQQAQVDEPTVESATENTEMDPVTLAYVMGNFEPTTDTLFVKIPSKYANREGMYLRKEAYGAFLKMYEAALKEGITIRIHSATRNFDYQKMIWENKWTGETILSDGTNLATDINDPVKKALKILEYSSMPGTSRHHWGTEIDINSFSNEWFSHGEGLKLYSWMEQHAHEYGFCQPYTPISEERPYGYQEEKWHWSYIPISAGFTHFAKAHLSDDMISGFKGADTAPGIGVVEKYILGINKQCY